MSDSIESNPAAPAPPPIPAQAPPATTNGFQRLVGVLFNPIETLREIAARPDILVPLALILMISIASSIVIMPRVDFESAIRDSMADANSDMSKEDLDRTVRFATASAKVLGYAAPLLNFIFFAAIAGILLLAFRLFGGDGTYKQAFSVTLYAWIPLLIKGVVMLIILLAKGAVPADQLNNLVMSNLGFLADMKANAVAHALLSSLDIFTIWSLALFIIGFSFVSRFSRARSAAIILSLWFAMLIVKVGFAAIGAASRAKA
ncbi:MAG: YIP1 family protein [Thermoanaerobaculia bacterium]|nr:YIP1 family protein [Thermoanaerobaculia bacterium]